MTGKMLSQVGASLVQRYGTRDPFQIARELGITVLFLRWFRLPQRDVSRN